MMKHQRRAVRKVMDMSLFVLFLLSGLLCSASGLWRQYSYINQNMSWTEAQSYCRERFTDLATVDSMDDVNMMINTVNDGYSGSVWIGLKRSTQGRWGWSNGDDIIAQYSNWDTAQPNDPLNEHCVVGTGNGFWNDMPCNRLLYFICYNESTGYVRKLLNKNWIDAQSYCRQYHTDLATVHNAAEKNQQGALVVSNTWDWIGLFLDSWQWSDQWSRFFRNWAAGQQFQTSASSNCVAMTTNGKWVQYSCDLKQPFICYGEDTFVRQQTVRLNFSNDGKYNLNDTSVQTAILNEISEKLNIMGLGSNTSIIWRTDEGGEVFHLESKHEFPVS